MLKTLKTFAKDESGATAIEYGLIAALVAVGLIAALTALGSSLGKISNRVSRERNGAQSYLGFPGGAAGAARTNRPKLGGGVFAPPASQKQGAYDDRRMLPFLF